MLQAAGKMHSLLKTAFQIRDKTTENHHVKRCNQSPILHDLKQHGFVVKDSEHSHWKCVAHLEMQNMSKETSDCRATELNIS